MTTSEMTPHTCLDNSPCAACQEDFDASPAGIVAKAIATLDDANPLTDLLQALSDEMQDEHCVEKEFPNHIPQARWQVAGWYGQDKDQDRWTYALATARHLLGLPNPNAVA